jgi:hypothetical protein
MAHTGALERQQDEVCSRRQYIKPAPAMREQIWAAYLLAWVAAFTDAIGYLAL